MNWRPVVIVIVLVALGGVGLYFLTKAPSLPEGYELEQGEVSEPAPGTPVGTEQARAAEVVRVEKDLEREEAFIYDSKKLRNPMTPFLTGSTTGIEERAPRDAGAALDHKIDGIMWSSTNPLAIIDGNVMGVGDTLKDGSSVTEIGRNHVTLKRGAKRVRLILE